MKHLDAANDPSDCPSLRQLKAFALGKLPGRSIEEIGQHLVVCQACRSALAGLEASDDSLLAFLGQSDQIACLPSELESLQDRLQQLPGRILESISTGQPSSESIRGEQAIFEGRIPSQLGQYRLVERISQGGMGAVYRAWHVRLKCEVALKLLLPKRLDDSQSVSRFYREMEVIGQLDDHPHIVRARDAGEAGGYHYLVMDYVDGIDVSSLLFRLGRLRPADACEIVRQAALGLDHAFQQGIVHRDVKPSNLMLTRTGQVKILDLGLAAMRAQVEVGELESDLVVGTADYMAPEQWTGSMEIDTRADVYSLGCTLYKLVVGRAPYRDRERPPGGKMHAHLREPIPSACATCPDIPAELDALTQRMMAKKPADRYQRPRDAAAALEPLAKSADLAKLLKRADLPDSETDPRAIDVTLVTRRAQLAAQRRARRRRALWLAFALVLAVVGTGGWWWFSTNWFPRIELLFPDQHEHVFSEYDWRSDFFTVHTDQQALFVLNRAQSPHYTLTSDLIQRDWQGGAGLFFDHRLKKRDDRATHFCQLVWLMPASIAPSAGILELCFAKLEIRITPPDSYQWRFRDIACAPVHVDSADLKHNIRVKVVNHHLASVHWDGKLLLEFSSQKTRESDQQKGARALGDYGFINQEGWTKFQKTRLY